MGVLLLLALLLAASGVLQAKPGGHPRRRAVDAVIVHSLGGPDCRAGAPFFRKRFDVQDPRFLRDLTLRLRADDTAGRLLREVERWLHAAQTPAPVPEAKLQELLAPYVDVPAVALTRGGAA